MNHTSMSGWAPSSAARRTIVAAITTLTAAALAAAPNAHASDSGEVISTADAVGITDPLAFVLSEHLPDLSIYPEFTTAMRGPDRCRLVSPLPCP